MPNRRWQLSSSPGAGADAVLQQHGPLVEVVVSVPKSIEALLKQQGKIVPQPVTGMGLIDTGCTHTSVSESVLRDQLELLPSGQQPTYGVTGLCQQNEYRCRLEIVGVGAYRELRTGSSNLPPGLVALIGRDVLSIGQFVYDGKNGHFTLFW